MNLGNAREPAADRERTLNDVIDFTWCFWSKEMDVAAAL